MTRRFIHRIARRLFGGVFVVVGVSVLLFVLARVVPGDPARLALGPAASPEQVEALAERLGLDEPLPVQYARYARQALAGDFGVSLYTGRAVSTEIRNTFPATLELVLFAMVFVAGFGVLFGVASGMRRGTWLDHGLRLVSVICVTTPTFVWAVAFMLVFGFWLELFPIAGRLSEWLLPPERVTGLLVMDALLAGQWLHAADALHHLVLPAIALSLPALGQTARIMRASMVETVARPYIEFARAYGVPEQTIAFRHALRPAFIPVLTILGLELVALMGNAFLVEKVFAWPGLARYGVDTILYKDLNGMMATVLLLTLLFVVVNAVVDLVTAFVDPRIRHRSPS